MFGLPGGHVEESDFVGYNNYDLEKRMTFTLKAATGRELKEETGLDAQKIYVAYAGIDDDGNYCTLSHCVVDSYDFSPEPGTRILWMEIDDLVRLSPWPKFYAAAKEAGAFLQ